MKKVSNNIKMQVLGSLEYAEGATLKARYQTVSEMIFKDLEGTHFQFKWRTIQTWWDRYRKHGLIETTLRKDRGAMRKVCPEDLLEAINLALPYFKQQVPNITALYRVCIQKGLLRRDQIASNTFRRAVKKYDLLKPEGEHSSKLRLAFSKAHANDMWQADSLHGPYLHINGRREKPVKTYLICFIDDASRVITHGEFFTEDDTLNLISCYQDALYKRGVPKAIYVDNGSNYAAKEFANICTRLGTILLHTPVRDGASKGKIERFFRTVRDQFLIRNLEDIHSLTELNTQFTDWVENTYHNREHSTLKMKPIDRFGLDTRRIRYLNQNEYNQEIFYKEATRKVRIDNTFSFRNARYEAPRDMRKTTIHIRYSDITYNLGAPAHPIVYDQGQRIGQASPVDFLNNDRHPNQDHSENDY
jgi:transposase InsO family protein